MSKRGYFEQYVVDKMIKRLSAEGKRLCEEAVRTKTVKSVSGNLDLSYIYIVCYDGIIYDVGNAQSVQAKGWSHKGLRGTGWEDGIGEDWWVDFYEGIKKLMRDVAPAYHHHGFDLFILNVAYYAQFLEDGSYAKGLSKILGKIVEPKKWEVTSQMRSECAEVASKLNLKGTKVERIGWDGVPLRPNNRSK